MYPLWVFYHSWLTALFVYQIVGRADVLNSGIFHDAKPQFEIQFQARPRNDTDLAWTSVRLIGDFALRKAFPPAWLLVGQAVQQGDDDSDDEQQEQYP
jgi:hypothetical protein